MQEIDYYVDSGMVVYPGLALPPYAFPPIS